MLTKRGGFTLLELAIYISISVILLLSIFSFFSDSVFHEKRLEVTNETLNDASIILQRLDIELRNSVGVASSSSSSICLTNNKSVYPYGSTKIYFQDRFVYVARSSRSDCTSLGTGFAVNSNLSSITNVGFNRIANSSAEVVTYTVTFDSPKSISKAGLSGDVSSFVYSSSVTLRQW